MVINQGDVIWVDFGKPRGSDPGYKHPCVVIQNNLFNKSAIQTVAVCVITSNLKRAASPGNVRLQKGEANLPKSGVVNITQIFTINKFDILDKIGTLQKTRMQEIISGIALLIEPRDIS